METPDNQTVSTQTRLLITLESANVNGTTQMTLTIDVEDVDHFFSTLSADREAGRFFYDSEVGLLFDPGRVVAVIPAGADSRWR